MMRSNTLRAALGGVALLLGLAEARADYPITASTAAANAQLTVCGFSVSNVVMPCHVIVDSAKTEMFKAANPGMVGLVFGGSALTLGQKPKAGSLPVALPTDPDILNAAATITAADTASTTATGQNGVSVVSGTPTAGSVYSYAVNGQSEADFTITGAFTGTLVFEGSANGGLTSTPRSAHVMGTKYRTSTITAPGIFHINAAGLTNIRVRATALTSGTPSVQLNTTSGTGSIYLMNPIEMTDNTTGLSASIKAGGTAAPSDPALIMQNPAEATALTALNTAIGACTEAAYAGTGTPTLCSVLKGMFGQAVASGTAGSAPPAGANIGYIQLVPGAQPQPISGTVTTKPGSTMASPAYQIGTSVAGNNAQVFATGAKQMFHASYCNKATGDRVLKFYDKATTPIPGTDAIVRRIYAPVGSCPVFDFGAGGFPFANGLAVAITLPGESDTGSSVAAGDITGLNIDHN